MATQDTTVTGYVHPQGGSSSGIEDADADWLNAVYLGAGYQANGTNYAPFGLSLKDNGDGTFDVTGGLAYIQVTKDTEFRVPSDSILDRSGTWTQPFLTFVLLKNTTNANLASTTAVNEIYLYYRRDTEQNDVYVRATDSGDVPTTRPHLKIGEIDPSIGTSTPQNRVAGYQWSFVTSHETDGFVSEANVSVPGTDYDEYKVVFVDVTGDATSSGIELHGTVNNVTAKYYYRTTQNNTSQASFFKILQARPDRLQVGGELHMTTHSGFMQYDNRTTSNEAKQYSFAGHCNDAASAPIDSLQFDWTSGSISGKWNVWGRNVI